MTDSIQNPNPQKDGASNYMSFIIRCWRGAQGRMHVRLIDAQTEREYLLTSISDLPDLVESLIQTRRQ